MPACPLALILQLGVLPSIYQNQNQYHSKLSCWESGSQLDPALGSPCRSLLSRFSLEWPQPRPDVGLNFWTFFSMFSQPLLCPACPLRPHYMICVAIRRRVCNLWLGAIIPMFNILKSILAMPHVETQGPKIKRKVNKEIEPRNEFLNLTLCCNELFYHDLQINWHNSGCPWIRLTDS